MLDINGDIKEYIALRHDITDIMNPKKQFLDDIESSKEPIAIIGKIKNYKLLKEFYGDVFIDKVESFIQVNILMLIPSDSPLDKVYYLDNGEYGFLRQNNGVDISCIKDCLVKFRENILSHEFIIDDKKIDIDFIFTYTTDKKDTFENLKIGIIKASKERLDIVFANDLVQKQKTEAQNNMKTVDILKDAIQNKNNAKIVSHFQAVMNNKTNEIEKYESLVRLINNDGSVISPFFFINISKKAGYYDKITEIVLENSFEALNNTDKEITINLSTMDIENIYIRNKLLGLITIPKYYGRVVFELLEDEVAKDFDAVKDFISLAKTVGGVKIAIDDFGSGYSNFERLVDFQPDILKIDGSLIKNIVDDSFSEHVVKAIVTFAKNENIQTVAEFVENKDILNKIKSLGIDYSQGFYIGKPDILD
jgi:EAL domain-containing protein (putative c-di-GMP-specific phosphodiesterase class I)